MPRPRKWRRICSLPETNRFGPLNGAQEGIVIMQVDEYETIRLIDYEGLKQEECAANMAVARTTVQAIYESARKKIADALVNSKAIIIEGGDYMLCEGRGCGHNSRNCARRYRHNDNDTAQKGD